SGYAAALALWSDIRVCEASTVFALSGSGSRRILTLIGPGGAVRLLEAGGTITADEALKLGLVSASVEDGKAANEAQATATVIASRGPIATRFGKEAIWRGLRMPLDEAL